MYVLGIETATSTGSVAVVSAEGVVAEYTLNIKATHSERLMAAVDRVLRDAGLAAADLGGLAVSRGPGSFTGLRVGISTVKGLAFATGKPVAAVPTLRALAGNLPFCAHPICPLLDARKNEVYAAVYRSEGAGLIQTMDETALSLRELASRLTETTVFTGEGSRMFRQEIEAVLGTRARFAPVPATTPSAASVAGIGLEMLAGGEATDPDALIPLYIRRPEAEVAWEKRRKSR